MPAPRRSRGQARGHRPCPKDNRALNEPPRTDPRHRRRRRLSRRRRNRCAGRDHVERRRREREQADAAGRSAAARSRPRSSDRSRGDGAPARRSGSTPASGGPRPVASSAGTSRRPRRSALRSPAGRTRASPPWSDSRRSTRWTRSCCSTSATRASGRETRNRRPRPGGGRRPPSRTPCRPNGRTTPCIRTSHPASRCSCRASRRRPASPGCRRRASSSSWPDAAKPDAHAKLLYGVALQRLGHRLSAQRQYDAAARLDPGDPETQVAAAVGRFDKGKPSAAFSRLGPLTKRFPHAATVRFHLGLMLLWLARARPGALAEGKRQLRLARNAQTRLAARQGSEAPARRSRGRTNEFVRDRTYGP